MRIFFTQLRIPLLLGVLGGLGLQTGTHAQILGSHQPAALAATTFQGVNLTSGVRNIGDVNNDGRDDLGFNDEFGTGTIHVLYTPASGYGLSSSVLQLKNVSGAGGNNSLSGATLVLPDGEVIPHDHSSRLAFNSAGDINHDGVNDLIVGSPSIDGYSGRAFLIYGQAGAASWTGNISLGDVGNGLPGAQFFTGSDIPGLFGRSADDWAGSSVSGAGDLNGDGFDDLLISAHAIEHPFPFPSGVTDGDDSGAVFAIYGGTNLSGSYNLAGTIADIPSGTDEIVNFADPSIHAAVLANFPVEEYPEFYIRRLEGAAIVGEINGAGFGNGIAAGDVNGDGKNDIIISPEGWGSPVQQAYLIDGQPNLPTGRIMAESIGETGVVLEYRPADPSQGPQALPAVPGAQFHSVTSPGLGAELQSSEVSVLGDVDGDGIDDLGIGPYIVFGKAGTGLQDEGVVAQNTVPLGVGVSGTFADRLIDVDRIGTIADDSVDIAGVEFESQFDPEFEITHYPQVAPAGDLNGDGLADVVVLSPGIDGGIGTHIVYGQLREVFEANTNTATGKLEYDATELANPETGLDGFAFTTIDDFLVAAAAAVGDLNQDGIDDLILTDAFASVAGESYLVLGNQQLEGDLDNSGMVGASDLDIILLNWGQTVTTGVWALGDPSNDGLVNAGDLDAVLLNWGNSLFPASVPEPLAPSLLCAVFLFRVLRRQQ